MKATGGLIGAGVLLVVGLFFLVSWGVMLLANVVLGHYHAQTLDYSASMAIVGLSALLLGGGRVNNAKD